jgi:hypothetical protein
MHFRTVFLLYVPSMIRHNQDPTIRWCSDTPRVRNTETSTADRSNFRNSHQYMTHSIFCTLLLCNCTVWCITIEDINNHLRFLSPNLCGVLWTMICLFFFLFSLAIVPVCLVRDSSVVRRHYILLLEPSNVRAQYIRKTADLLLQLWVSTFPRFVAIGFYFLSETLI